jgi:hypothetical protein
MPLSSGKKVSGFSEIWGKAEKRLAVPAAVLSEDFISNENKSGRSCGQN